jgi:hypothetical protein
VHFTFGTVVEQAARLCGWECTVIYGGPVPELDGDLHTYM